MKPKLVGAVFAAALSFAFFAGSASAITLNTGESAIYNFDLTGQTPAPPYNFVFINLHFGGVGSPPAVFDVFDGLNATGALAINNTGGFAVNHTEITSNALIADGIFSVKINASGLVDVLSLSADAQRAADFVSGLPGELATPLPAALPLFAGGLGVIGLLARRRKQRGAAKFS